MIEDNFDGFIGSSDNFIKVISYAERFANSDVNILIAGGTGTGKKMIAKAIHKTSKRKEAPFVIINCSTLSVSLFESEMFGYVKGAFTGALNTEKGLIESAEGGTIVFDKIEYIPIDKQQQLIELVEKKEFRRVGGRQTVKVDVRFIFTTSTDLKKAIEKEKFVDSFYYRIAVVNLYIPSLKERKEDLPEFTKFILRKIVKKYELEITEISSSVLLMLKDYSFPGNIRELENILTQCCLLETEETLYEKNLLPFFKFGSFIDTDSFENDQPKCLKMFEATGTIFLDEELKKIEKELVKAALTKSKGHQTEAAKMLNITERSMRYRVSTFFRTEKFED